MAGHHKWAHLRESLSPERKARIQKRVDELEIGLLLAEVRKQSGLTQQEVAERLGITQSGVSQMECEGDMHVTTLRRLVASYGGEVVLRLPTGDVALSPSNR